MLQRGSVLEISKAQRVEHPEPSAGPLCAVFSLKITNHIYREKHNLLFWENEIHAVPVLWAATAEMWVRPRTSTCVHPAGVGVLLEGAASLHRVESTRKVRAPGAARKEVLELRHLHGRCRAEWECSRVRVSCVWDLEPGRPGQNISQMTPGPPAKHEGSF